MWCKLRTVTNTENVERWDNNVNSISKQSVWVCVLLIICDWNPTFPQTHFVHCNKCTAHHVETTRLTKRYKEARSKNKMDMMMWWFFYFISDRWNHFRLATTCLTKKQQKILQNNQWWTQRQQPPMAVTDHLINTSFWAACFNYNTWINCQQIIHTHSRSMYQGGNLCKCTINPSKNDHPKSSKFS